MGDKSVATFDSKTLFSSVLEMFPPSPKTMLIFLFLQLHRAQHLHNIELGAVGIRELILNAMKIAPFF